MTAAAVKALMESHLSLAERTGDAKVCGEAASTAVAMFPEDEDVKYSTCEDLDALVEAGFSRPTTQQAFKKHLTKLETLDIGTTGRETLFNNWSAWNTDLPCLRSTGGSPFAGGPLISFDGQLPALETQYCLFNGVTGLQEWKNDLPNLVNGDSMFKDCTSLEDFTATLPSLLTGVNMFDGCSNLSISSLLYIAQNINDLSGLSWSSDMQTKYNIQENQFSIITISVAVPTEAAPLAIYNEASMIFGQKGWTVVNTAS